MPGLLIQILRLFWKAATIKVGVDWLRPSRLDKKLPFEAALTTAVGFTVLTGLLWIMLPINPLLFGLGWFVYVGIYIWIFAKKFELGFFKTIVMFFFQKVSNLFLLLLLKVLPLVSGMKFVENIDTFGESLWFFLT